VPEDPDPQPSLSFVDRLPLTQAAIEFAGERHAGQRRPADEAPFLVHPIEVASILERSHYPDHVVAAAVLHDVLEDTDGKRSELEEQFGPDVAELVAIVSDDPAITVRKSGRTMFASAFAGRVAMPPPSMPRTRSRRSASFER
jgi:(p)ppGpp synthase/HD superfamily hydrolase